MKRARLLLPVMMVLLLTGCRHPTAPPEEMSTAELSPPLTVIHATQTDAGEQTEEEAPSAESPTGNTYDSDGVIGQSYLLSDIVDFDLLENAARITADYRDVAFDRQISREEWNPDEAAVLLPLLRTVSAEAVASVDTANDPAILAVYFEAPSQEGAIHRFAVMQTATAYYLSFDWTLLRGEELDDPSLLFRVEDRRLSGFFPVTEG